MEERSLKSFFLPGTLNFNRNQSLIPVIPNIDHSKNNLESLLKCILLDSDLQETDLIILGEGPRICFDQISQMILMCGSETIYFANNSLS